MASAVPDTRVWVKSRLLALSAEKKTGIDEGRETDADRGGSVVEGAGVKEAMWQLR